MKKIMAMAAMLAMLVTMTACGTTSSTTNNAGNETAQTESTASDLDYIKDKGNMVIGYTIINPLNYTDESGKLVGFETEFATLVCEKLGVKPEFLEINWDSKEVELNSKNIDCIWNGMTITDERKNNMSITIPYMENRQVMIVKAENEEKYTDSVDGANVVAEKGSTGEELAEEDEFFANANYTALESQANGLIEVSAGTSDVLIADYTLAGGSVGEGTDYKDLVFIDKNFDNQNYGIAFRKGSDITEAVNDAMKELAKEGKLQELAEKYGLEDLLLVK